MLNGKFMVNIANVAFGQEIFLLGNVMKLISGFMKMMLMYQLKSLWEISIKSLKD